MGYNVSTPDYNEFVEDLFSEMVRNMSRDTDITVNENEIIEETKHVTTKGIVVETRTYSESSDAISYDVLLLPDLSEISVVINFNPDEVA